MTEISMWDEQSADVTAAHTAQTQRLAVAAVEPLWPFLSQATSAQDFFSRMALVEDTLTSAVAAVGADEQASFAREALNQRFTAEHTLRVAMAEEEAFTASLRAAMQTEAGTGENGQCPQYVEGQQCRLSAGHNPPHLPMHNEGTVTVANPSRTKAASGTWEMDPSGLHTINDGTLEEFVGHPVEIEVSTGIVGGENLTYSGRISDFDADFVYFIPEYGGTERFSKDRIERIDGGLDATPRDPAQMPLFAKKAGREAIQEAVRKGMMMGKFEHINEGAMLPSMVYVVMEPGPNGARPTDRKTADMDEAARWAEELLKRTDWKPYTSSRRTAAWIDDARAVVDNHQHVEIGGKGGVILDYVTAGMLVQIHDALGPEAKAKFEAMDLMKAVDVGWRLVEKTKTGKVAFNPATDQFANLDALLDAISSLFDGRKGEPGDKKESKVAENFGSPWAANAPAPKVPGYQPTGEIYTSPCDTCGKPVEFEWYETGPGGFRTSESVDSRAGSDWISTWCPEHRPSRRSSAVITLLASEGPYLGEADAEGFVTSFGALRDFPAIVRTTNGGEVTGRVTTQGSTYPMDVQKDDGGWLGLSGWRVQSIKPLGGKTAASAHDEFLPGGHLGDETPKFEVVVGDEVKGQYGTREDAEDKVDQLEQDGVTGAEIKEMSKASSLRTAGLADLSDDALLSEMIATEDRKGKTFDVEMRRSIDEWDAQVKAEVARRGLQGAPARRASLGVCPSCKGDTSTECEACGGKGVKTSAVADLLAAEAAFFHAPQAPNTSPFKPKNAPVAGEAEREVARVERVRRQEQQRVLEESERSKGAGVGTNEARRRTTAEAIDERLDGLTQSDDFAGGPPTTPMSTRPRVMPNSGGGASDLTDPTEVSPQADNPDFAPTNPMQPTVGQRRVARAQKVAERIRRDNPTMPEANVRALAARVVSTYPEMVRNEGA